MDREAVYDAWVPAQGVWSLWARPVLFGHMPGTSDAHGANTGPIQWAGWAWDVFGDVRDHPVPEDEQPWRKIPLDWAPPATENVAIIVDLPAEVGVHLGLALAARGYRPVPLYNGCPGPNELIDQGPIMRALRDGAAYLATYSLANGAPPAFLLDWRRACVTRPVRPGSLDNRWRVLLDDLPSPRLLRDRGVSRVLLVQREEVRPHDDLAAILRIWKGAGIDVEAKYFSVPGPPSPLHLRPTPWFRRWLYALSSALGLQRGPREGYYHRVGAASHG